jgi:Ca2+/Na+ antiporter
MEEQKMTKKRKMWFIAWAVIIILSGIHGGVVSAIFPLLALGFIELICLFVKSVKRSKVKLEEQQKGNMAQWKEQAAIIEEALITTGYPPQNMPPQTSNFFGVVICGILLSPIGLFIIVWISKSSITKQQNRVKEARIQRGITLSNENYAASEVYFDKRQAEFSKGILPAVIAWIVLVIVIALLINR